MNKIYIFLIIPCDLNKIKRMKELIYTRPAEQTDAQYIHEAHAAIDASVGYDPSESMYTQELIEKRIANPDHRRYIVAMAGKAIIGSALLVETPIPLVKKRGQYIDMIAISEGTRSQEVETRLLAHAAQLAIMNAPEQNAENSFLRMDPLTRSKNIVNGTLRARGEELARLARGNA